MAPERCFQPSLSPALSSGHLPEWQGIALAWPWPGLWRLDRLLWLGGKGTGPQTGLIAAPRRGRRRQHEIREDRRRPLLDAGLEHFGPLA